MTGEPLGDHGAVQVDLSTDGCVVLREEVPDGSEQVVALTTGEMNALVAWWAKVNRD